MSKIIRISTTDDKVVLINTSSIITVEEGDKGLGSIITYKEGEEIKKVKTQENPKEINGLTNE